MAVAIFIDSHSHLPVHLQFQSMQSLSDSRVTLPDRIESNRIKFNRVEWDGMPRATLQSAGRSAGQWMKAQHSTAQHHAIQRLLFFQRKSATEPIGWLIDHLTIS
jgi:hypothetical protein